MLLPFGPDSGCRSGTCSNRLSASKAILELFKRRPLQDVADLPEQVVRERRAFEGRARL
jgi:hypothetical protein